MSAEDKPIRLYQLPPVGHKRRSGVERELMLRPPFPPIYHEGQLPPANETSEVIVITEAIWNVGDLVDWWKDQCFWSGKVTQILGNEEAMVNNSNSLPLHLIFWFLFEYDIFSACITCS